MRHRLFCSLVLSSSFLVDGCATAHSGAPTGDAATPDDAASGAGQDAQLAAADAGLAIADDAALAPLDAAPPPPDAWLLAEPDAPPTGDDGGVLTDPRACEPGWPTTKGIFHVMRDGLVYGCRFLEGSTPEMPDLDRCCIVGPAS
jgi:predicted small secreted protein